MECLCAGARNALPLGRVSLLLLIVLHLLVVLDHHGARNDLLAHLHLLDFLAVLAIVVFHALHLPSQLLLFPLQFLLRPFSSPLLLKVILHEINVTAQLLKGAFAFRIQPPL